MGLIHPLARVGDQMTVGVPETEAKLSTVRRSEKSPVARDLHSIAAERAGASESEIKR
jgi:hypothetical protein